jgi:putative addiction module component (TIGR02574 family)
LTEHPLEEITIMIAKNIKRLSQSEKILLVQDLWDDISGGAAGVSIKDEEIDYVNKRIHEIQYTDEALISWDEVKKRTAVKRKR